MPSIIILGNSFSTPARRPENLIVHLLLTNDDKDGYEFPLSTINLGSYLEDNSTIDDDLLQPS